MPDALTRRFQQTIARIGEQSATLTANTWRDLPGYDEADIPTFAQRAGPTLHGTKVAAVATGVAYYAVRARVRPPGINPRTIPVDPDYREPFIAFWQALGNGTRGDEAVLSGMGRAESVARNLATSAARIAGAVLLDRTGRTPTHWIRVPDADACDWCLEAADATYRTAEDADIGHDRCGCSIEPA